MYILLLKKYNTIYSVFLTAPLLFSFVVYYPHSSKFEDCSKFFFFWKFSFVPRDVNFWPDMLLVVIGMAVGISTCDGFGACHGGSMPLSSGPGQRVKNGVAIYIRFRNHIYKSPLDGLILLEHMSRI